MTLRASLDGHVATITIDNPARRNAMTAGMWRSLPGLLEDFQNHSLVRVVVLTGAGDTFCAGADIAEILVRAKQPAASPPHDALEVAGLAVAAEQALASFPKPTIARIAGDCVGGGCQLALACDLRVAAPGSRFGVTPARLGVVYPAVSTTRLVHTVGPANAKWLLLTADLVPAAQALRIGLIHEITGGATGELDARVDALAATLASRSLLTQAAAKEIIADPQRAESWMELMRESGEAAEGASAFLARRPPAFPWKGAS